MSLETVKTEILGYSNTSVSAYGSYSSSDTAIKTAIEILELLQAQTQKLPTAVKADGVILKYPRSINVEVDDQGGILVLDGMNHDFEFTDARLCAAKVKDLLCRA